MDSLTSVSPSIGLPLPLRRYHHYHRRRQAAVSFTYRKSVGGFGMFSDFRGRCQNTRVCSKLSEEGEQGGENQRRDEELERAMRMDGTIPGSSDEFVKQVSSHAYDMRRHLQQSFDSSSYDVLEANPWREASKSVYVLTHQENQLCLLCFNTCFQLRSRGYSQCSEVERELGLLFSKREKQRNQSKQSGTSTKFQMLVEDVQEGVLDINQALMLCINGGMVTIGLVFEDQNDAVRYCDLLQGGGQNCEGVAEIEASSVFDLCQKNRALAVLFRRGRTPPLPESLKLNLKARKRSLEDQEDSI